MKFGLSKWSLRNRLILTTLLLATIAIGISDFAASNALRSFLVTQADSQLISIANASLSRLDLAGIDTNSMMNNTVHSDDSPTFMPVRPLSGVPSTTAVTLLDLSGNVVGQIGGDFSNSINATEFEKLTPNEVILRQGKPFTISGENDQSDIRAIAKLLPSGMGTVVISVALDSVEKILKELRWLFLLISLIVLLLIAFFSRWIIKLSLKPLSRIEDTAAAIAEGNLSARLAETNPKTEVGRLTGSLNTMLGRIEESFEARTQSENKLRRFVADASHELRTPLTAIRGFAELHRQGAVKGADQTTELVGRIEKESIRMGSLVEDLLLLARLDQARELAKDPVDINHLVQEVVASARAAGPSHEILIATTSDEIFVLGDSMRIHQAVANLLANARTHTPAGTSITVEISQNDFETQVKVSDNGPGLSPQDQLRIFERFYRADPSRVRSSGEGSGLGLAIVEAVMQAHHGSVTLNSKIGEGSTFTLHFPISNS